MKLLPLLTIAVISLMEDVTVSSFSTISSITSKPLSTKTQLHSSSSPNLDRRSVLTNLASSVLLASTVIPAASSAAPIPDIPSVTSSEFDVILRDSAKSIVSVELSGVKSETALVRLADGTTFSISDLVESSTDPRSPLKLVARCRLYNVPVKNVGLAGVLSGENSIIGSSGKKKKSYMNKQVQKAEEKEQAKRERMAEDERERLAELYRMEGEEKGFLE
mmetsp:Transcript_26516/g.39480  ORF Transcript_26516/g.39480 Transcript_26516/m.39480 type:complete len:220 (-) Transcript_26516:1362-2021(-)